MRTVAVAIVSCLFLPAGILAQERTTVFRPGPGTGRGAPEVGMIAVEPFEAVRPVTGVPYEAEAITETTQTLADGNRIERRTSASIARDGRGRVRREHQAIAFGGLVGGGETPLVTISDPATGTHVTLDRERRIATRVRMPAFTGGARGDGGIVVATPGVRVGRLATSVAPISGSNIQTENLAEREIEGVRAEGVRTTVTIEAHTIGNQAPIVTVSERWYSPVLQVVVLTRRSDPRFGETVYRLANIVRAEPPAHLFEVPPDYRIEDQTMRSAPAQPGVPRQ